jgi:nicotinamidase/pyrazinamidase
LLVVDVQNDFCTGGALAVRDSERVIRSLNAHLARAAGGGAVVYASRDWHPSVTSHFRPYGGRWPVHCVKDTDGARFHPDLDLPSTTIVISKGEDAARAGYSAFDGRTEDGRTFAADLHDRGITHLMVGGLATDYCVKQSVLDALAGGFDVTVLSDAIAGVDAEPGDSARALEEMRARGAQVTRSGLAPQSS